MTPKYSGIWEHLAFENNESGFRTCKSEGLSLFLELPFQPLYERLPELAEAETRVITVLDEAAVTFNLPTADYAFVEMFCNEAGCDCRRVFFTVVSSRTEQAEAVIAYGWESPRFYREWFKQGTAEDIAMLQGPELNVGSPQSMDADGILNLFTDVLLPQKAYIERVKRHYKEFRATVDRPRNPLLRRRRTGG